MWDLFVPKHEVCAGTTQLASVSAPNLCFAQEVRMGVGGVEGGSPSKVRLVLGQKGGQGISRIAQHWRVFAETQF